MTDDRHKLRQPLAPPSPSELARQQLNEAIKDGRYVTRELRAVLGEIRTLVNDFNAQADRICEETSEEAIRARVDKLLSKEAVKAQIEPTVAGIIDLFKEAGDTAIAAVEKRETALIDHIAKMLGTAKKTDLLKMIADMIIGDVLDATKDLRDEREATEEAVRALTSLLPGDIKLARPESLAETRLASEDPKPPPRKPQHRHHRRGRRR